MMTIKATFSHGLIKPLEKLDLPEGVKLTITIEEEPQTVSQQKFLEGLTKTAGAWKDIDADKFLEDVYKSRAINTRPVPEL